MTSAATAKILLFIALSLGPKSTPGTILATSSSENYSFSSISGSWALKTKGLPADEWISQSHQASSSSEEERNFRAISRHEWHDTPVLDLSDGSQVIKQKDAVFYIEDPGAPNQKVFTILYSAVVN